MSARHNIDRHKGLILRWMDGIYVRLICLLGLLRFGEFWEGLREFFDGTDRRHE